MKYGKYRLDEIERQAYFNKHPKSLSKEKFSKINEQMDKSVCKILKQNMKGTGFICSIPFPSSSSSLPVLMTCYHVLGEKDLKNGKIIKLLFNNVEKVIIIDRTRRRFAKEEYDISIIELKEEDNIYFNSLLEIEYDIFNDSKINDYKKKSIYIIHYPEGKEIQLDVDEIKNIDLENNEIDHLCQTKNGSSGGPILNFETCRLIGIHIGALKEKGFNLGTILVLPIYEFNKKYYTRSNIMKDKNRFKHYLIDSYNWDKNSDKKSFSLIRDYINIQYSSNILFTIDYNLSGKTIKDIGIIVKIPNFDSKNSLIGFLTNYHADELILKNITSINIKNGSKQEKINPNNIFIFSDPFLGVTFIETKDFVSNFVKIFEGNINEEVYSINFSDETNDFKIKKAEIIEKWGINIFYKEEIDFYDYDSSYRKFALFEKNELLAICKHTDYKYDVASNIQIISKAIKLNYDSKKRKILKNIPKEPKSLTQNQIEELNEHGLTLSANPNILISLPSKNITPIWFYRTIHGWYWTPTKPEKDDINKSNWMIIFPGNSLKVIGGYWDGIEPAYRNIKLINWLETTDLKFLI